MGNTEWGHRENRRMSRGRGGDPHAKWNGGPKKSCLGALILVLTVAGIATDLVVNYI